MKITYLITKKNIKFIYFIITEIPHEMKVISIKDGINPGDLLGREIQGTLKEAISKKDIEF